MNYLTERGDRSNSVTATMDLYGQFFSGQSVPYTSEPMQLVNPDAWNGSYAAENGAATSQYEVPTVGGVQVGGGGGAGGGGSGSLEGFARRLDYHYEFAKRSTAGFRNDLFGSAVRSLIGENDWSTALRQTGFGLAVFRHLKSPIMRGLGVPTINALFERSIIGGVGFDSIGFSVGIGTRLVAGYAVGLGIEGFYWIGDTMGAASYALGWASSEMW
jgi:hypothetical protein